MNNEIVENNEELDTSMNSLTDDHNSLTKETLSDTDFSFHSNLQVTNIDTEDDLVKKVNELKYYLTQDTASCDFMWSLFHCALNSYRFDTCLRPYPSKYLKGGFKDSTTLRKISVEVPDMYELVDNLKSGQAYSQEIIDLLHWVIVQQREPVLRPICDSFCQPKVSDLYKYIPPNQFVVKPHYIYHVIYSEANEKAWQNRKNDKEESIYAFHGSRLDNFYSIVKFGLQQHMCCSDTLYGQGIYLSSELLLSLTYSPTGCAWDRSIYGSNYSLVALCEIINDKDKVRCQDMTYKRRATNAGSMGGTIPDKYYVVLDSDMVRVRYLLMFKNVREPFRRSTTRGIIYTWMCQNKMLLLLSFYALLLMLIGFFNGPTWRKHYYYIKSYFRH